jgi:hypothetical protein
MRFLNHHASKSEAAARAAREHHNDPATNGETRAMTSDPRSRRYEGESAGRKARRCAKTVIAAGAVASDARRSQLVARWHCF